jgi:DNA repair protein RecO (recombination protein O)
MLTSKAIVLSRENFGEADCYIEFLTEDWGVVTTLAKSARKSRRRYVGGLDIFCHDEISVRGDPHDNPYLDELKVLNTFLGLREEVDRVFSAGRIVQWIQKIVAEGTPVPEVYRLLGQVLALLEKEKSSDRILVLELLFKMKLISLLGFKPRVETCGNPAGCTAVETFLDMGSGILICPRCAEGRPLLRQNWIGADERNFLAVADQVRLTAWDQVNIPVARAQHLNRMITNFASFHTQVLLPL